MNTASTVIQRLREALASASYTYGAVADLLGPVAHAALGRNETTPGLRATADGSALATLTRLWLLQAPVSSAEAERALPGLVDDLCGLGVLERSASEVAALIDLRPYAAETVSGPEDLWVLGDLTPGLDGAPAAVAPDHVLGISPAATSLAQLTVRAPVGAALDLGTGCGVQALHLAAHADRVVATDVNRRALWLTGLNAALNEIEVDCREGSYFDPVAREQFDLITTNPPFVISPATGERLVYRDSGLPGDRAVEEIVRAAPRHLRPGGTAQILANWAIEAGIDWRDRLAAWFDGNGCDVWVVQREVLDVAAYVELWLKDAGQHPSTGALSAPEYRARCESWLAWFAENRIEAVGFGWLNLRATTAADPGRRLEEWPWEVEQPLGGEVGRHFAAVARLRALSDAELLRARPRLAVDVVQETSGSAGAEDPATIVLRRQTGMRRARQVDTGLAALAGAADGELTVGQLVSALGELLGPQDLQGRLGEVRELVEDGFLALA